MRLNEPGCKVRPFKQIKHPMQTLPRQSFRVLLLAVFSTPPTSIRIIAGLVKFVCMCAKGRERERETRGVLLDWTTCMKCAIEREGRERERASEVAITGVIHS